MGVAGQIKGALDIIARSAFYSTAQPVLAGAQHNTQPPFQFLVAVDPMLRQVVHGLCCLFQYPGKHFSLRAKDLKTRKIASGYPLVVLAAEILPSFFSSAGIQVLVHLH